MTQYNTPTMQWEFWDYDASSWDPPSTNGTASPHAPQPANENHHQIELPIVKQRTVDRSTSCIEDFHSRSSMLMYLGLEDLQELDDSCHSNNNDIYDSISNHDTLKDIGNSRSPPKDGTNDNYDTISSHDGLKDIGNSISPPKDGIKFRPQRRRTIASEHPIWTKKWQFKSRKIHPDMGISTNRSFDASPIAALDKIISTEQNSTVTQKKVDLKSKFVRADIRSSGTTPAT